MSELRRNNEENVRTLKEKIDSLNHQNDRLHREKTDDKRILSQEQTTVKELAQRNDDLMRQIQEVQKELDASLSAQKDFKEKFYAKSKEGEDLQRSNQTL